MRILNEKEIFVIMVTTRQAALHSLNERANVRAAARAP
jgi:hypothetical protein